MEWGELVGEQSVRALLLLKAGSRGTGTVRVPILRGTSTITKEQLVKTQQTEKT
jgi:hypothetical protein